MKTQNVLPIGVLPIVSDDEVSDTNPMPSKLVTALSSEFDTIDVNRMTKGGVTIAHNAIVGTTTSSEIDCRGFNTISVECAVSAVASGNWVIEILGCAVSGGTFGNCYRLQPDGWTIEQTPALNSNSTKAFLFEGVPNYIKILATRTTDGTLTCTVTPMNL